MWRKKIVTSLICMFTMILLCSTSYAATNETNMGQDLEQNLTTFEQVFSNEMSHFNLDNNDIINNNLELGEIYQNNTIDITNTKNTKELSKKLKHNNKYVSTIKLKDSGKPIALAFIEKKDSKWIISRINSYNLLDQEIKDYKEAVDSDPVVIIDQANKIYALGSDQKDNNSNNLESNNFTDSKTLKANNPLDLKIIEPNNYLNLNKGQVENLNELQSKLIKAINTDSEVTTGISSNENTSTSTFSSVYLLISVVSFASLIIFSIVLRRHLKNRKTV